jgi:hypothetical protein
LVGSLFYDTFAVTTPYSVDDGVKVNDDELMMNDMVGSGHGLILMSCPGIRPERLRKTIKTSIRIVVRRDRDLNPEPPEYEEGVLTTQTTTFGDNLTYLRPVLRRIFGSSTDGEGPWLRSLVAGLSPRRPGFVPGSIHVGFVMDKVALGQVFLRVLLFSPVNIIPPSLSKIISSEEYVIC